MICWQKWQRIKVLLLIMCIATWAVACLKIITKCQSELRHWKAYEAFDFVCACMTVYGELNSDRCVLGWASQKNGKKNHFHFSHDFCPFTIVWFVLQVFGITLIFHMQYNIDALHPELLCFVEICFECVYFSSTSRHVHSTSEHSINVL